MDGPVKSAQEPAEGHGNQQGHALGAGQADRLGNQFPDDYVQCAQEGKCAGECDGMGEERGVRPKSGGPNGLKYFCKRGFAERTNRQASEGDAKLYAGNDTWQIAVKHFDNARAGVSLSDSCRTRDKRTATRENSVAAKKPLR